jgi:mono/diheme cytochrome c family protein
MRSSSFLLMTALAIGCGKAEAPPPSQAPPPGTVSAASGGASAKAKATTMFEQRCVPCHGAAGGGDGVASASLDPRPRAFGDPEWQASVTDEHIIKIIKFGGAAVGKSAAMPNNPDLTDPDVVAALKDVVRSFAKQ